MTRITTIAHYYVLVALRSRLVTGALAFNVIVAVTLHSVLVMAQGDAGLAAAAAQEIARPIALFCAVFLVVTSVNTGIEDGSIGLLLARPLPRGAYLLGVGLAAAAVGQGLILVNFAAIAVLGSPHWGAALAVLGANTVEVVLMVAVTLAVAAFATPAVTVIVSASLYVIGNFGGSIAYSKHWLEVSASLAAVLSSVRAALPNFETLDFDAAAATGHTPDAAAFGLAVLAGLVYASAMFLGAAYLFGKRDLK